MYIVGLLTEYVSVSENVCFIDCWQNMYVYLNVGRKCMYVRLLAEYACVNEHLWYMYA